MLRRIWIQTALFNFLLAALIGALLRYAFVQELAWMDFKDMLHAHSHVAMLGWVYLALYAGLCLAFLPKEKRNSTFYHRLFWLTELSVLGMLFTFPFGGYTPASIAFSTLHVILAVVFVLRFWKDMRQTTDDGPFSQRLARSALVFQVLSFAGILSIGPVSAILGKATIWYYLCVQFFLHFQFNGWFLFALLALFFRLLERGDIRLPQHLLPPFFWLLILATFSTYALAVAWASPQEPVFWVNSLGALLQLGAVAFLPGILRSIGKAARSRFSPWVRALFGLAFSGFLLKVLIQTAVVIPYIATVAYTVRNFVIGFIHLLLLGVVSPFLFGYALHKNGLDLDRWLSRAGLLFFLAGVFLSEGLLFLQGLFFWMALGFLPGYYTWLFGVSALMPLGLLLLLAGQSFKNHRAENLERQKSATESGLSPK